MRLFWVLIWVVPDDRVDRNWTLNNCTTLDERGPTISDGTLSINACESGRLPERVVKLEFANRIGLPSLVGQSATAAVADMGTGIHKNW